MAGVTLRFVEALSLLDPQEREAKVSWDDSAKSLLLTYPDQQQAPTTTILPRGEDKILGQNVLGGVQVTIAEGTVVGAVYLPACVLDANACKAYLQVSDSVAATISVSLQIPGPQPSVVASFDLSCQPEETAIGVGNTSIFMTLIPAGWYEIFAGLSSGTATGAIHGLRLVVNPVP